MVPLKIWYLLAFLFGYLFIYFLNAVLESYLSQLHTEDLLIS